MSRAVVLLVTLAAGVGFATPARAVDLAPIDGVRPVALTYDLGATSLGLMLTLGPVRLAATGYGIALPGLGGVGGLSAMAGCRLSPAASGPLAWGVGVTGYAVGGMGSQGVTGYAAHPALIGTLPVGEHLVFRAALGPLLFTGTTGWQDLPDGRSVRRSATGFVPLLPNAQLAWRLGDGSELTFGGYPSVVGWRYAL